MRTKKHNYYANTNGDIVHKHLQGVTYNKNVITEITKVDS